MYDIQFKNCGLLNMPLVIQQQTPQLFYLFYIFNGSGILIIDSSHYLCGKNQLFLFSEFDLAIAHSSNHSNLLVFYVSFACNGVEIHRSIFSENPLVYTPPIYRDIFMRIFHENGMRHISYQELCSFYLEEILVPLIVKSNRNHHNDLSDILLFEEKTALIEQSSPTLLDPIVTYIEQNLSENISPTLLAHKFHINERQLNQLFQKNFYHSTTGYILSRRLSRARELLCFSSCTITEIAEITGFHSIHYFSQIFKKKEGISPNLYRKKLSVIE